MSIRTVTLLAAVTQLLGLVLNITSFLTFALGSGGDKFVTLVTWSIHLLAQAMLVIFLFYLFRRQRAD